MPYPKGNYERVITPFCFRGVNLRRHSKQKRMRRTPKVMVRRYPLAMELLLPQ